MKSHCNQPSNTNIEICTGHACAANFSAFLEDRVIAEKKSNKALDSITVSKTGCQGNCKCAPNVRLKNIQTVKNISYATGPKLAKAMHTFFSHSKK
jgi:NADH:ubiquinone oxidoreductase subunit E